jgi:predicted phage terminase large subunit-like protein
MELTQLGAAWRSAVDAARTPSTGRSFREYVNLVNPRYRWFKHCEVLADVLEKVARGEIKRLMVFMPPRHGKSEEISRLFPGYYLELHGDRWVGLTSYAAGLAFTLSRNARENYQRAGNLLNANAGGVEQWETVHGGGLWAAGVGGAITGKGAHLGIVDDPLKNAEEANSEVIREKHKDWWRSTFYTRLEPDAALIVVQTRWHEEDLSGYLISQEEDDEPEGWTIVNLPAIAEEEAQKFPATCSVIPDWRKPGEALGPERYSIDRLRRIERRVGSYYFGALYQQRPTALAGDIFKREWWQWYTTPDCPIPGVRMLPPALDRIIQSWDFTFKDEADNDYVSGQVWGQRFTDDYLLDRVNERMSFSASCAAITSMRARWPQSRGIYIEDKANGPAIINALRRTVRGIVPVKPDGGKIARAYAVQPTVEGCYCYLPHPRIAPWIEDFIRQLAQFPRGVHDDDVDACTQALNVLSRSARDEPAEEEADDVTPITPTLWNAHVERERRVPRRQQMSTNQRPIDPMFGGF